MASPAIQSFATRDAAADARSQAALTALAGRGARKSQDIWVVNAATVSLGVDFNAMVAATQIWLDVYHNPAWGIACKLRTGGTPPAGAWVVTLVDLDTTVRGALGYHAITNGVPYGRVLVQTTLGYGEPVSVVLGHEVGEILADPHVNLLASTPTGVIHAVENCDAVEDTDFKINGIVMTNFQYPAWFEAGNTKGPYDAMKLCKAPFQLLKGGYSNIYTNGVWSQIFGSQEAEAKFFARHGGNTPVFMPGVRAEDY